MDRVDGCKSSVAHLIFLVTYERNLNITQSIDHWMVVSISPPHLLNETADSMFLLFITTSVNVNYPCVTGIDVNGRWPLTETVNGRKLSCLTSLLLMIAVCLWSVIWKVVNSAWLAWYDMSLLLELAVQLARSITWTVLSSNCAVYTGF